MKFFKDMFGKAERFLEPQQGLVTFILLLIIAGSVFLLFSKNVVSRTAWAAWMVLP